MHTLELKIYEANEWRLFIDSLKQSIKVVLFHNKEKYAWTLGPFKENI